jgi:hypothetical protein
MDAANEVRSPLFEGETHLADPLMVALNCIHIRFAFDLARIYDVSQRHPLDEQQKASIPILLHHLSCPDVQDVLVERSLGPVPGAAESESHAATCRAALEKVTLMSEVMKGAEMAEALDRLRQFRNRRLAHYLYQMQSDVPPLYMDLYLLVNTAREFIEAAGFAIKGLTRDLQKEENRKRPIDDHFWSSALIPMTDWVGPEG